MIFNTFNLPVPPQITPFDFSEETVNTGDMTSVFCTVTKGDFPIKIKWTLNGHEINSFEGISISQTNKRISQLAIDSVQANHAGEYICEASNFAGSAKHSAYLHINGT